MSELIDPMGGVAEGTAAAPPVGAGWQPACSAPKDRMILVDTGMPWASIAIWNEYAERWVLAELEWSTCAGIADPGFVTEWEPEIRRWMELPGWRCD